MGSPSFNSSISRLDAFLDCDSSIYWVNHKEINLPTLARKSDRTVTFLLVCVYVDMHIHKNHMYVYTNLYTDSISVGTQAAHLPCKKRFFFAETYLLFSLPLQMQGLIWQWGETCPDMF